MISKHLKHYAVQYSAGLAFLAAASAAGTALWAETTTVTEANKSSSLTDSFICSADSRNGARMPEYISLASSLRQEADAIRSRFLNIDKEALRAMLEAQHPDWLEDDEGALAATWGRDDPQHPGQIILDRKGGPAYIRIDLAAGTYEDMWMRDGVFTPQGQPSYNEVTPDGMTRKWLTAGNSPDNPDGPALLSISTTGQTLNLSWYVKGEATFINGSPTQISMDLSTNIVFFEEYGAYNGPNKRITHRPSDHLRVLERDRRTGRTVRASHMYHTDDLSSDEVTRDVYFDPETGVLKSDQWHKNGADIAAPSSFSFTFPR